ncbi:uncharacterized protein BDR25DRAFT_354928 [Lindgomyces ingoldianus]|uniref:Uncharacterized protein n=1 Tax=Lindgomyces ingoldianus TaxID=673940 RepID=A0ACB6QVW3_9PLEO|nr:uncharacterized protein BDR25DRAFT_354928 [Lindgomyces ingoldianus]KAF2471015.1 hypothetical protein BDR25DRAFT_354928 [Lindgomyces ingoldianus]
MVVLGHGPALTFVDPNTAKRIYLYSECIWLLRTRRPADLCFSWGIVVFVLTRRRWETCSVMSAGFCHLRARVLDRSAAARSVKVDQPKPSGTSTPTPTPSDMPSAAVLLNVTVLVERQILAIMTE